MVKRATVGLVKGLLLGGAMALLLIKGLGVLTFGAGLAYLAAVVTGGLAGLLTGRPVWAHGARIEAGVKAFAGALLAAGLMFMLRRWGDFSLDLTAFGAGAGALGELPIFSLPLVATVLALLFEVDNTGEDEADEEDAEPEEKDTRRRVAGGEVGHGEADELSELDEEESEARRRRRRH